MMACSCQRQMLVKAIKDGRKRKYLCLISQGCANFKVRGGAQISVLDCDENPLLTLAREEALTNRKSNEKTKRYCGFGEKLIGKVGR